MGACRQISWTSSVPSRGSAYTKSKKPRGGPSVQLLRGCLFCHGESFTAAIAVPGELQNQIRWTHNSDVTSCAHSSHPDDSGKPMEEFERSVLIASSELKKLRAAEARFLAVRCDGQVELPPHTETTGPQASGSISVIGAAHEHQWLMLAFLQQFGFRAVSTWIEG